jgi:cytochrome P450
VLTRRAALVERNPVVSIRAEDVDLSSIDFWGQPAAVREAGFAALRREKPISFHEEFEPPPNVPLPRGPGYWALTKHRDVLEVSRNPERFCSGKGTNIPDLPEAFNEFFGSMINMDDPKHGRLRRIVSRGFTPRALGKLEEGVQRRAKQTIDRVIDKGACDFVSEIAQLPSDHLRRGRHSRNQVTRVRSRRDPRPRRSVRARARHLMAALGRALAG